MPTKDMIKLIIFDFDGTLGDTRRNIVTTMQMTIAELGLASRSDDECASKIGLPLDGCFEALYPDESKETILFCTDTYRTGKAARLRVFSPMFGEDEIPLRTLFRTYQSMPKIEQTALDMAKGRTLDVGAASGCHSLVLQERGIDVTAIDISPLSVETMKERGVKSVREQDFFMLENKQYDTILMLMNGIGIVGTQKVNIMTIWQE